MRVNMPSLYRVQDQSELTLMDREHKHNRPHVPSYITNVHLLPRDSRIHVIEDTQTGCANMHRGERVPCRSTLSMEHYPNNRSRSGHCYASSRFLFSDISGIPLGASRMAPVH